MKLAPPALILAAAMAGAGLAQAQPMGDMKGMAMAPAGAAKTGHATGVVKAIDAKAGTVTLQHGAIPSIGWPPMTMAFKARPPAMLNGLKVGQTVDFEVRTPPAGPEITAMTAR